MKDATAEAKERGNSTMAIRPIIKLRKNDPNGRQEEALVNLYKNARRMA